MKLSYPLKDIFVTQLWGENPEYYSKNYGVKAHNGIDYRAPHGTPVYATHDGFAYYEKDISGGEGVVIRSKEKMEIEGVLTHFKTIYWHFVNSDKEPQYKSPITCRDINSQGQEVKCGDLIGYADNTGYSAGSHLHFGLKPVSEGETLGVLYNPKQNNGYAGAVNPMPYMPSKFKFLKDMQYGQRNDDIKELQKRLIDMGYCVPSGSTGYYGQETRKAISIYQSVAGVPLTWYERFILAGSICGKKTRERLNAS